VVEFKLTLPEKQNIVWIPKEIADTLGRKLKIMPNSFAAVLYPENADLDMMLKSLAIIQQQLQLRTQLEMRRH
jgi:hypothetical protein